MKNQLKIFEEIKGMPEDKAQEKVVQYAVDLQVRLREAKENNDKDYERLRKEYSLLKEGVRLLAEGEVLTEIARGMFSLREEFERVKETGQGYEQFKEKFLAFQKEVNHLAGGEVFKLKDGNEPDMSLWV